MSDATATPGTPRPASLWTTIPRGTWIALGIGAAAIALCMWWGVHAEASERARIADEGGATMQGPLLLAFLGVLVPIVIALIIGAAVGGSFAVRAALAQPTANFGRRFAAAAPPALACAIGAVVAATIVGILAVLISGALGGLDPAWGTLLTSGGVSAAIAAASSLACLTIATLVAGVMLRSPRK